MTESAATLVRAYPTPSHVIAALVSAVELLPDGQPDIPETIESDSEVEQLRQSIAHLAQRLATRHEQDVALAHLSQQVMHGLYLDDVLTHLYKGFRGLIPYDRIGCALLEDDGRLLRARWARSESMAIKIRRGFHARMAGSSLATILETGRPRILNDLRAYLEEHPHSPATARIVAEGMQSSLTCPLVVLGKPIGFLFFSSAQVNCYRDAHTDVFERLASLISAVVERSLFYERLEYSNSELRSTRDLLQFEATHDSLTGALNRRAIMTFLEEVLAHAAEWNRQSSILLLDIDHFKRINDEHGHPAGDAVLSVVAKRISEVLREGDLVGRYGGEEFLFVLQDCSAAAAYVAAERVLDAVRAAPIRFESMNRHVTASIGVATCATSSGEAIGSLIRRADAALYRAKESGRNRACAAAMFEDVATGAT